MYAKTAEPMEMLFGGMSREPKEACNDGVKAG